MEKQENEKIIEEFHCHLNNVNVIEDLFPPEGGVREPLRPLPPNLPSDMAFCSNALMELCLRRQHRQLVMGRSALFLAEMNA